MEVHSGLGDLTYTIEPEDHVEFLKENEVGIHLRYGDRTLMVNLDTFRKHFEPCGRKWDEWTESL
jgi:hypothetical protein